MSRSSRRAVWIATLLISGVARGALASPAADELRSTLARMSDAELAALGDKRATDWTAGVLYAGLSTADQATGDGHNAAALRAMADRHGWRPNPHGKSSPFFADDHTVCQTYLDLYDRSKDPAEIKPTVDEFDKLIAHLQAYKPGQKLTWWWCDALFMAPAAMAHLSAITGDRKYLDAMDAEWWRTSALLYDPREHLYFRDAKFLPTTKPTTQPWRPVFWARGNGWVVGGIARVLTHMPADYPSRAKYVAQFRDVCDRLAAIQPADGLWRTDLLIDPATVDGESSGTALNVYAMAWGINHGLLDRERFLPVVAKGYAALRRCVRPDGRLGYGQPAGYKPGKAPADSVTNFGVGAFLLAGAEVLPLVDQLPKP